MKIEYSEYNGKINIYSDNDSNPNCMNLKWNNGRMDINISNFLPCTVKDWNMFIDIIDKTEHARQHVDFLAAVLLETVNIIEKSIENSYDASAKAKRVAALNKWQRLYNALAKRFNLAKKENNAEQVKYKKAVVYPFVKWDDGKGARPVDGYAFEKYGFSLYVYKHPLKGGYHVIVPCFGLSACNGSSKAKAVAAFTPELAETVKRIFTENKTADARKNYADYLAAADLADLLNDPFYDIPVFDNSEKETTQEATKEEKTTEKPEAATTEKEPEKAEKENNITPDNITAWDIISEKTSRQAQKIFLPYCDMKKLNAAFSRYYDICYNMEIPMEKQRCYTDVFDDSMNGGDLVIAFSKFRNDYITSDRESAAFVLALGEIFRDYVKNREAKKHTRPGTRQKAAYTGLQSEKQPQAEKTIQGKPEAFTRDYSAMQAYNKMILLSGDNRAGIVAAGEYAAGIIPRLFSGMIAAGKRPPGSAERLCSYIDNVITSALYNGPQRNNTGMVYQYTKNQKQPLDGLATTSKEHAATAQPIDQARLDQPRRNRGSPGREAAPHEAGQPIPVSGNDRPLHQREKPPPIN